MNTTRVPGASLSRSRVRLLSRLAATTGARVVVTSSWREHRSLGDLRQLLHDRGFEAWRVAGATPYLPGRPRGAEILAYLREAVGRPCRLAVLDDQNAPGGKFDLSLVESWLVRTVGDVGLTRRDVERATALLTGGPFWPMPGDRSPPPPRFEQVALMDGDVIELGRFSPLPVGAQEPHGARHGRIEHVGQYRGRRLYRFVLPRIRFGDADAWNRGWKKPKGDGR